VLKEILSLMKKNFIFDSVIKHFIEQIFYFIDAQVFNTLLKRPDLFTVGHGFQIKMSISQLESALSKADKHFAAVTSYVFQLNNALH
jgi:hypothetical protein